MGVFALDTVDLLVFFFFFLPSVATLLDLQLTGFLGAFFFPFFESDIILLVMGVDAGNLDPPAFFFSCMRVTGRDADRVRSCGYFYLFFSPEQDPVQFGLVWFCSVWYASSILWLFRFMDGWGSGSGSGRDGTRRDSMYIHTCSNL